MLSISPTRRRISPRSSRLELEPEGDVLGDRHVREQPVGLEHHVDVALGGRHPGHVLALQQDPAARRLDEARDHAQRRRLAAAARAEHREELAAGDLERHAVDRGDLLKALRDVVDEDLASGLSASDMLTPPSAAITNRSLTLMPVAPIETASPSARERLARAVRGERRAAGRRRPRAHGRAVCPSISAPALERAAVAAVGVEEDRGDAVAVLERERRRERRLLIGAARREDGVVVERDRGLPAAADQHARRANPRRADAGRGRGRRAAGRARGSRPRRPRQRAALEAELARPRLHRVADVSAGDEQCGLQQAPVERGDSHAALAEVRRGSTARRGSRGRSGRARRRPGRRVVVSWTLGSLIASSGSPATSEIGERDRRATGAASAASRAALDRRDVLAHRVDLDDRGAAAQQQPVQLALVLEADARRAARRPAPSSRR